MVAVDVPEALDADTVEEDVGGARSHFDFLEVGSSDPEPPPTGRFKSTAALSF